MADAPVTVTPEVFEEAYLGRPPWDLGLPQPALEALVDAGRISGRVLDAGCGTGELTLLLAARGFVAAGVDVSPRAIALARAKAERRGVSNLTLQVADVLDLPFADGSFDTVVDSGVLHVFGDADRARYMCSLRRVLVEGGVFHCLVFSDAEPGVWGPRRMSQAELEAAFATGWRLVELERSLFELTEGAAQAWRAAAVRTA